MRPPGCGSAGFARLPQGFLLAGDGKKRRAAVPLEGGALSLWGIRPISEKEQVPPGKRTCGPFPIRNLFLF